MDDSLESFEADLKQLRPAAPSPGLRERLRADLARPTSPGMSVWWMAAALPVAASITLLAVLSQKPAGRSDIAGAPETTAAKPGIAKLAPVSIENVLYAAEERIVVLDDGTRARRARLQYVDTFRWQNPQTRASLTWTVPREEVRIIPTRYQ